MLHWHGPPSGIQLWNETAPVLPCAAVRLPLLIGLPGPEVFRNTRLRVLHHEYDALPCLVQVWAERHAHLLRRVEFVEGSFFEKVPPADVHILQHILHDWDDAACVKVRVWVV